MKLRAMKKPKQTTTRAPYFTQKPKPPARKTTAPAADHNHDEHVHADERDD